MVVSRIAIVLCFFQAAGLVHAAPQNASAVISVEDFLPEGYTKDGSVSYPSELQRAIDTVADGSTLVFPPIIYRLQEDGLRVKSHLTLSMYGAIFRFDEKATKDGQAFRGDNVSDVQFFGGEILGSNETWPEGVNLRGIHLTGASTHIRIRDMRMRDLSSNGIGVFGSEENPASDIWVNETVVENCCNRYGDYSSGKPGPEKGSKREDQGSVCFYYVNDWLVAGCRFERSRSDGTHFFKSHRGQFVHNKVYAAQMGGYFIEGCEDVLASENLLLENGSRGATIERGARRCTLTSNVIARSGREGLWAPDCEGLIVTDNFFDTNGRKPNGKKPQQVWNANITINESASKTRQWPAPADYLVANNVLTTTADQIAAIRVDANVATGIVIHDNVLRGENRQVLVEGPAEGKVTVRNNE